MNDVILENLYMEGIWDRTKSRMAGLGAGAKAVGGNLKNVFTGGQNVAPAQAASQAKLKSITTTFQNEMKALFGDKWNVQYPQLAQELTTLSTAPTTPAATSTPPPLPAPAVSAPTATTPSATAPDKSKPIVKDQIVTGAGGKMTKGKYKVLGVNPANKKITVQPIGKSGAAYGTSSQIDRSDIVESKKEQLEDLYQRLLEVPKL